MLNKKNPEVYRDVIKLYMSIFGEKIQRKIAEIS
jgi:hypothetical protein